MKPQEFFNLLSDETRLRSLLLLQKKKELCVCELTYILETTQPKISRHLSSLRKLGVVLDERRGQWVFYRLNEKIEPWMRTLLATISEDLKKQEPFKSDLEKVQGLSRDLCF